MFQPDTTTPSSPKADTTTASFFKGVAIDLSSPPRRKDKNKNSTQDQKESLPTINEDRVEIEGEQDANPKVA